MVRIISREAPRVAEEDSERLAALGRYMRDQRRALGLTQTQLAVRLGWMQERISLLENGKYGMPSLPAIERLADGLDVTTRRPRWFDQDDLRFLQAVSHWVGVLAHRAELIQGLANRALSAGEIHVLQSVMTRVEKDRGPVPDEQLSTLRALLTRLDALSAPPNGKPS